MSQVLRIGDVVRTSYDTGPYLITEIEGPCTCADFLRHLNGDESPSEPHYHLTCEIAGEPRKGSYWLNGYRLDGTSVWSCDRVTQVGAASKQLELFT